MLVKVLDYNGTHLDVDIIKIEDSSGLDFHAGVAAAVFVTIMSEMGDKSFFMSAILAMRHSQTLTFLGSILGQAVMTAVAVVLGMAASYVPEAYTKWASCFFMTFFGLKMLKEGFGMPLQEEDDSCFDHNQNLIANDDNLIKTYDKRQKISEEKLFYNQKEAVQFNEINSNLEKEFNSSEKFQKKVSMRRASSSEILVQAFTLSFLGEWGDRSQIATILLATTENPYGVAVGSLLGHIVCSLTAVVLGRQLGQKFPVKNITQAGGIVFLLCAISSLVFE